MEKIDDMTTRIARDESIDYEQLGEDLPATVVLELVNPKTLKEGTVTELTFTESTGAHIELINKAGTDRAQNEVAVRVICECCGIGPDEYRMLGTRDIKRLSDVLGYFLDADSPQTASPQS